MHIHLEAPEQHAIQAYGTHQIQINSIIYQSSFIVSREEIITDLVIKNVQEIDDYYTKLLIRLKPELIIIGHCSTSQFPSINLMNQLAQQKIGLESMSIGAACRTYIVLLSEHRLVIAGFIF